MRNRGLSLIEVLFAVAIIGIIAALSVGSFVALNKQQALNKDIEKIVAVLQEARSQTLSSYDGTQYGVHFAATRITLFSGATYSSSSSSNKIYVLNTSNTITTITLAGGGSAVVFDRLTGDTSNNGTVVISSPTLSQSKTVTIYKTGLTDHN